MPKITNISALSFFLMMLFFTASSGLQAAVDDESLEFEDYPLTDPLKYPDWFKQSFLDLRDDLEESIEDGKKGIIVYFGQKRCPYCQKLINVNFGQLSIESYTRKHFDLIPIDIWGIEEVTDTNGVTMTQRDFALREKTNFTPSMLFIDHTGKVVMRLRGYYPPYQFMAALQYVAEEHYKREKFHVYLSRGTSTLRFEKEDMVEEEFFMQPPYNLDRSHFQGERPLVVFFEHGDCHACDILHAQPLKHRAVSRLFDRFDSVQLNMFDDTPVVTPDGQRKTASEWAREMEIFYAPSMVFFDEYGKEIIRIDSVIRFFRLRNVLNYILSGAYRVQPSFQIWRSENDL